MIDKVMKFQVLKIMILIAFFTGYQRVWGQCTGGSNAGSLTMNINWQSISGVDGMDYYTFSGIAGYTYYFSFCPADGGSATKNTEITINTNAGAAVPGAYNDDYCGTKSYLAWTCATTATYRVLVSKATCKTQTNLGTLAYRYDFTYTCPAGLGTGVTNVASLPYASGAGTTCGAVNDINSIRLGTTCGTSSYYDGEDRVWIFTPAVSGQVTVTLTNSASNVNLSVFDACPISGSANCVGYSQGNNTRTVAFCATAGQPYYIVADCNAGTSCFAYTNLTISSPNTVWCNFTCPAGLGTGVVNVASLPYSSGAGTTCGKVNDFDATRITSCGTASYYNGEDMVWVFTPATSGSVTINLNTLASNVSLSAYWNCPLNGNGATCMDVSQGNGNRSVTFCVTSGQTYYVIADAQSGTGCFAFSDLSISTPVSTCNLGTGQVNVVLPYSSANRTTCGKGDDLNAANVVTCGDNSFMASEDEVFVFTATATGTTVIKVNTAGVNSAIYVYDGCPLSAACGGYPTSCVASRTGTGNKTICVGLITGHTYYVILDSKNTCFTYSISMLAPVNFLPGITCGSPYIISSLPILINQESTECYGDDYNNSSPASCGTSYESGEDKVYRYIATGPICLSITISGASTNSVGVQVYGGCPGTLGSTCIKSFGGAISGVLSGSVNIPSAGTYFIVVDTWASPSFVQYNIKIEDKGSVDNDLPCNAQPMALNFFYSGTNHCATGSGDPAAPGCWATPNTINSVWYSFVAPASGNVVIRTALGTLKNTQIALYSGTCGSGMTLLSCNVNAPSCGGSSSTATSISQITSTGLTPGTTYYVVVDGYGVTTGTFSIIVNDGATAALPDLAGQDCGSPIIVCNGTTAVGDPGFSDFGNKCDFPGSGTNCLSTAERGSVWYQMNIGAAGTLEFNIVPNDWPGAPSTSSTDYDFAIWKIAGSGATSCSGIASGATPVRCNYSALGVTGCYNTGNSPASYPGFNGSYESGISVNAGDIYLLVVSNYSNSTSGFTMYFPGTAPIDYTAGTSSVYWTGSVDNDWFKIENWGGCNIPSCTVDATILSAAANQPYIYTAGSACKSLNIQPGSVLNIGVNRQLSICGNVINNGNIVADRTSYLFFGNGSVPQSISGNLVYPNSIGNVVVDKTGSSLDILQNIDITGNLTLQPTHSNINALHRIINLEGNLYNPTGQFNMDTTGILNLIGTTTQTFNNVDTLTNVTIDNAMGITMNSKMLLSNKGVLTLSNGKVVTNAYEVSLLNSANNAVNAGSTTAYIEGSLRRSVPSVSSARQFDFPVGNSTAGYQRINMNFFGGITPAVGSILTRFYSFAGAPPKSGNDVECWVTYQDTMLNNGYWTITSQGTGNADANITLYNLNYSNAKTQYCVAQSSNGVNYTIPALNSGMCTSPPATAVLRNAVANALAAGVPKYLGTAQGYPSPLPVELVSLVAQAQKKSILVKWITASEKNNAGFYLQRSNNGFDFSDIQWLPGAGTVNLEQFYNFDDKNVVPGILYYYRLNQVDFDGKSTISEVVSASLDSKNSISLAASPNPYKGSTNLTYKLPIDGYVKIIISDVTGRIVRQINNGFQKADAYTLPLSATGGSLRGGVYYVTLYFNDAPSRIQITELN